jgi:cell division protease FtsH
MAKEPNENREQRQDRPGSGPGWGSGMPPRKTPRIGMAWLIIIVMALLAVALFRSDLKHVTELSIDQFYTKLKNGDIAQIVVSETELRGKLRSLTGEKEGSSLDYEVSYPQQAMDWHFMDQLRTMATETGTELKSHSSESGLMQILTSLLPFLLVLGLLYFLVFRQLRNSAGGAGVLGNFGRSRHRVLTKERTNITFEDVAGIDEAKDEVGEIVEFLRNPTKFQKLGGRIPRGVLLVGEPGCGKTLLAKAIAGEAEVPFFSISGSDFVEMFVGVGASRVRDLFAQAKAGAPCIIFLDEIDAVGRRRGAANFSGGGHDEREQTLNAILVEIDGFDSSDQVIVIAATNRADVLDPALTRPGRFDRQVFVPLPDIKGRYEILKVHAKNVKLAPDVDLMKIARGTSMLSGADLAAIINEAAIGATLANKEWIETDDLEEARDKIRWGRTKKSRFMDEHEREETAYHEAGHALVSELLPEADPVHKVSIIPRAQAGGMTMMLPETDRHFYSRRYLLSNLRVLLAGRAAEELACGDISTGASDDIKRASRLARTMVCEWGMSDEVGPIRVGATDSSNPWGAEFAGKEYSEQTAQTVDSEVQNLIRQAYQDAKRLLEERREAVDALAQALLKYETLGAEDVHRIMRGESIDKPTVGDLLGNVTRHADEVAPLSRSSGEDVAS